MCQRKARSATLRVGLILFGAALLLASGSPAQAQRLPLPPNEQAAVDRAIERGVKFLKSSAQKNGTWARFRAPHPFGYTALPGLTLLECGVPPDDPLLQHAAHNLRANAANINETYELSLAILFLDRLGDPKDSKLIQTFALRLVAGQSSTGGWGYKCPILGPHVEKDLLTVLRHLNPPPADGMPGIATKPGDMPAIARGKDGKPGDLGTVTQVPGAPPLKGIPTSSPPPSPSGTTTNGSPGSSLDPPTSTTLGPNPDGKGLQSGSVPDLPDPPPDKKDGKAPAEPKLPAPPALPNAKKARPEEDKPAQGKEAKPFVIPERLQRLAVVQNPDNLILIDPVRKSHDLFLTTTDNSNTQFAILALWTAQRHDVPMVRSLHLIARRYQTSQNADGSWGYHYRLGGGEPWGPAMTCVGLIGLAVGHGLANHKPGGKPVQDPRILNGFVALSRSVGTPGQVLELPMRNLYYLWSLERVAVLYNLPKIGDKDWYRWGAGVLVANQGHNGNWAGGGYPGSHPTIDTCLALLFLKRANLVKDLTSRLPFNPADLNQSVLELLTPSEAPAETPQQPLNTTTQKDERPKPVAPPPEESPTKAPPVLDTPTATRVPEMNTAVAPAETASGDGKKKWVVLSLALFVVLAGSSLFFLLASRRTKENDSGKKGKRKSTTRK